MPALISHEQGYEYNKWYVKGTRWNGQVMKMDNGAFQCTCDQFKKHKWCEHIGYVSRLIEK